MVSGHQRSSGWLTLFTFAVRLELYGWNPLGLIIKNLAAAVFACYSW